jgi:hypothetical protein
MKDLIDTTIHNLTVIKHKACYDEDGVTKCYKCPFGKFNSDIDDDDLKWMCLLDATIGSLNHYRSFFNNKEKSND